MILWPLLNSLPEVPVGEHAGAFGAIRKYDIHTGVDLYCEPGTEVVAVESGEVVNVEIFTGPKANSPWWNETYAVWVYNSLMDRTIVYGEVIPEENIIGSHINSGSKIGRVRTVLKKDKGLPMTMLHFEMYSGVPKETCWWKLNEPKPEQLLDPTQLLIKVGVR